MSARLPWFKCFPSKLLGALAGMEPDEGYLYVTILMRIYEDGGPIRETARILGRRTNMSERRAGIALASLVESGRVHLTETGAIDSETTHDNLAEREEICKSASEAGKLSAQKRAEKKQQNQGERSTPVEPAFNETSTKKKKKENEIEIEKETPKASLGVSAGEKPPAAKPKKPATKKIGRRIEADEKPNERQIADAHDRGFAGRPANDEWLRFRDHHLAKGTIFTDWEAAWRTWLGNAIKFAGQSGGGRSVIPFAGGRRAGNMTGTIDKMLAHAASLPDDDDLH